MTESPLTLFYDVDYYGFNIKANIAQGYKPGSILTMESMSHNKYISEKGGRLEKTSD